jgi:predicted acylesterase/phospholipase RssA
VARGKIGIALAGGGPLGAIWEIGALVALDEALLGLDLVDCDILVGVSSGAFIAAGLANGITPCAMHRMFIDSAAADDPFEPEILLQPAVGEYLTRLAMLPGILGQGLERWIKAPSSRNLMAALEELGRALPTGLFDNSRIGGYLARLFSAQGRSNDFRELHRKLFLIATALDTCEPVAFGSHGWDDVPISRAVQASAALPGLFPPVDIRGRHFVDGVLMKTVHASVALQEGAELLLCINPIVPFNAKLAARHTHSKPVSVAERGLSAVLSQAFRAIIHSRMQVAMGRYATEYPSADIVLLEPGRDDPDMFFTNVFSYSARRQLSEHAYQKTRAELWRRRRELQPTLARHGLEIDVRILADRTRSLTRPKGRSRRRHANAANPVMLLDDALDELAAVLRNTGERPRPANGAACARHRRRAADPASS